MKLSKVLFVLAILAGPTTSMADSLTCLSASDRQVRLFIINHNSAATGGTRTHAAIIFSRPKDAAGEKTRLAWRNGEGDQDGANYVLNVADADEGNRGDSGRLFGINVSEISVVKIGVTDFSFNDSNKDGNEYHGEVRFDDRPAKTLSCKYALKSN